MLSVITVATEIDDGIATVSACREDGPPLRDEPAGEQVHRDGRERPEERVHDLEPRIRGLEVGRDPEDEREHCGVQRPEAVFVAAQAQTVALDERRRTDHVAHLVGMDARHAHERRQERVGDERAEDDRREREQRACGSESRHPRAGMVETPRDARNVRSARNDVWRRR